MGFFFIFLLFFIFFIIWAFRSTNKENAQIIAEQQRHSDEELLRKIDRLQDLMEVKRQAKAIGDTATDKAVNDMQYNGPMPEYRSNHTPLSLFDDLRIFDIAGINYCGDLSAYIGDFRGTIKPEPTNDYDNYAIMITCEDGHKLGYVREEQTDTVRWLVGSPQSIGEDPTEFPPHRITGYIRQNTDDTTGRQYFHGWIYIRRVKAQ